MRILVAGVGNMLRSDDGFGVAVANRMLEREPTPHVTVAETGIAGIQLIQELQDGHDAIIVVDTADRERPPGTVMVIDYEVVDVHTLDHNAKYDLLADMHLATPDRSLMVAKALGVLPSIVWMVAVQPLDADSPAVGLSHVIEESIDVAIVEIDRLVQQILAEQATSEPSAPS